MFYRKLVSSVAVLTLALATTALTFGAQPTTKGDTDKRNAKSRNH